MARMHRSTTAHIQLGMGLGKTRGRHAPWRCVFPGGRQRHQSRGNETLQGRCEDGTTICGETPEIGSDWLGAFDESCRGCRVGSCWRYVMGMFGVGRSGCRA